MSWPQHAIDEKTNSEVWVLWRGRWATGWGRPIQGGPVNRVMLLGRPFLKSFGKWERLRPGQPTRSQIAGSIFNRVRGVHEGINYLLGEIEAPRGWGKQRVSKQQRILLTRMRDQLIGIRTDAEYLVPPEALNGDA